MRILHTIYDDPANPWLGGGGAFRTFEICERLSDRHDITIVCGRYPGAKAAEERGRLSIRRVGSDASYAVSRLAYSVAASRHVAAASPDLWVYSFSAFAPLIAGQSLRSRAVLECFHVMQTHAAEKSALFGPAAALIESATLETYDDVISISPSVASEIARIRRRETGIHLVYTGVDDTCFLDDPEESDYILYFGRLDTYTKGLDLLFDAWSRAGQTVKDLRLVVAGRGTPERLAELDALARSFGIADRVTFTGPVDTETKTDLFRRSLFNVATSRYEGWCIAAVEASAAGKAVVGTRIPGLMDAVRDEETGLLAEPEDVDGIAARIRRLVVDSDLRRRLGAEGRRRAEAFTWDAIAVAQEQVYRDVVASRAP